MLSLQSVCGDPVLLTAAPRRGRGTCLNLQCAEPAWALECHCYLSFILNTRPSVNTTLPVFPPENPTGAPFLEGARVIVIWSPDLTEVLFQPFLCRMPGLWDSMPQFTTLPLSSLTSRKICTYGLAHTTSVTVPDI